MGTLTANATANLTANGNKQGTGTISWTKPNIPAGATIDSVVISGMWSWNGVGNVKTVTINGTATSADTNFSVPLSTSVTSPISITCNGNKNATGNQFTWTGPTVTYTYTVYYNVSVGTVTNGTVSLSQSGKIAENTTISITATPNKGYKIGDYLVNGSIIPGTSFSVTRDSVVTVTFLEKTEALNIKINGTWTEVQEVYKKIGGVWVLQDELAPLFNTSMTYVKKN